jgi:hypothetical protein
MIGNTGVLTKLACPMQATNTPSVGPLAEKPNNINKDMFDNGTAAINDKNKNIVDTPGGPSTSAVKQSCMPVKLDAVAGTTAATTPQTPSGQHAGMLAGLYLAPKSRTPLASMRKSKPLKTHTGGARIKKSEMRLLVRSAAMPHGTGKLAACVRDQLLFHA